MVVALLLLELWKPAFGGDGSFSFQSFWAHVLSENANSLENCWLTAVGTIGVVTISCSKMVPGANPVALHMLSRTLDCGGSWILSADGRSGWLGSKMLCSQSIAVLMDSHDMSLSRNPLY